MSAGKKLTVKTIEKGEIVTYLGAPHLVLSTGVSKNGMRGVQLVRDGKKVWKKMSSVRKQKGKLTRSQSEALRTPIKRKQRFISEGFRSPRSPELSLRDRSETPSVTSFIPEPSTSDRSQSLPVAGTPQRPRRARRVVSESAADALRARGRLLPRQRRMEAAGGPGPKGPPGPGPPGIRPALAKFANQNEALQIAASNIQGNN